MNARKLSLAALCYFSANKFALADANVAIDYAKSEQSGLNILTMTCAIKSRTAKLDIMDDIFKGRNQNTTKIEAKDAMLCRERLSNELKTITSKLKNGFKDDRQKSFNIKTFYLVFEDDIEKMSDTDDSLGLAGAMSNRYSLLLKNLEF